MSYWKEESKELNFHQKRLSQLLKELAELRLELVGPCTEYDKKLHDLSVPSGYTLTRLQYLRKFLNICPDERHFGIWKNFLSYCI